MAPKINKLAGAINTHHWQICYLAGLAAAGERIAVEILQFRYVL
jgi:hypothetical protein